MRVPASTSNLGPGFDALGLALELGLDVRATPLAGGREHELVLARGPASTWPRAPHDNLLVRSFELGRRHLGGTGSVRFEVASDIPVGRGLGSSGAAVAAGLLLAASLAGVEPDNERLLELGLELEGHPDNLAPALLGGCVLCAPRAGGGVLSVPLELHPGLSFALAWPDRSLPTEFARSLLPREVAHADAVDNARRLAALVEGLRTADPQLIACGQVEHLHVRWRLPHIPGGEAAIAAALECGASLATVSGSGTALFAIADRDRIAAVAQAMGGAFEAAGEGGDARVVQVARDRALVVAG